MKGSKISYFQRTSPKDTKQQTKVEESRIKKDEKIDSSSN